MNPGFGWNRDSDSTIQAKIESAYSGTSKTFALSFWTIFLPGVFRLLVFNDVGKEAWRRGKMLDFESLSFGESMLESSSFREIYSFSLGQG